VIIVLPTAGSGNDRITRTGFPGWNIGLRFVDDRILIVVIVKLIVVIVKPVVVRLIVVIVKPVVDRVVKLVFG
jgi:hypothetical protein